MPSENMLINSAGEFMHITVLRIHDGYSFSATDRTNASVYLHFHLIQFSLRTIITINSLKNFCSTVKVFNTWELGTNVLYFQFAFLIVILQTFQAVERRKKDYRMRVCVLRKVSRADLKPEAIAHQGFFS